MAKRLAAEGYSVFTSVAPGEAPVAGTEPLFVPFALLPDLCEHAGWAVAVRSGISDILAPTRCRKTFFYPNMVELAPWSVNAMDYCRDAYEITFDFVGRSQQEFSRLVRSPLDMSPLVARPRQLSRFVGLGRARADTRRITLAEVQRDGAPEDAAPAEREAPAALILEDLPYRAHPRLGAEVSDQLTRMTARARPGTRFFVCRDRGLSDYFEEVGAVDLIAGRYTAARHWHTAVAVDGVGIADLLPEYAREKVLPIELAEVGRSIRPGEFYGDANHLALNDGLRPFAGAGIQFVEGWSGPEPWGMWSNSGRSRMKLNFAAPPGPAARLELRFNTALSDALPEVGFTVGVNGRETLRSRIRRTGEPLALTIPFGAALDPAATSASIVVEFDRLASPYDQGSGPDRRLLGMGLIELAIHDTADASRREDAADAA